MSKTTITIVTFIAVVTGLFVWGAAGRAGTAASVQGAPGTATSGTKSALSALETFYDFGTISMKNGNVTKEFTVTNPTNEDITVKTVLTSCMCTTAFVVNADGSVKGPFRMPGMGYVPPANETIKAGESRIIRVVYDPNAHGPAGVGQIDRFVMLTDSSDGTLELEIKALVTP
ncbi:MAG: DUF1573 domain-containing protein [bacterium]|nr:DUF1573 domain-containing protein [bacterium]